MTGARRRAPNGPRGRQEKKELGRVVQGGRLSERGRCDPKNETKENEWG